MNDPNIALEKHSFVVVSDIHADPTSLDNVYKRIPTVRYDVFLGDVVGYGSKPNEAVEKLKRFNVGIRGNHEDGLLNPSKLSQFSSGASESLERHIEELTQENTDSLDQLTSQFRRKNMLFYHGTPDSAYEIIMNEDSTKPVFDENPDVDLFFGGHMHIPRLVTMNKKTGVIDFPDINSVYSRHVLDLQNFRYMVNVPSISRPRMGTKPGACTIHHSSDSEKILNFYFTD